MLSCDCLNVIIQTQDDDFEKVTPDLLDLSPEALQDPFFKQEIRQVGKLLNINKSHSGLIQTRNVGPWVVHYCINCDVHSHAVHRDKGASCVLVNWKLLKDESIERLKASHQFSKLYKIIIKADNIEDDLEYNSYVPRDLDNIIRGLKLIASDIIKREAVAVEERIKAFTDEEYNKLNDLRERAFREQEALTRIILNSNVDKDSRQPASTKQKGMSDTKTTVGVPSPRLNDDPSEPTGILKSNPLAVNPRKQTPKRQKSCPVGHVGSFDSRGLFEFDDIQPTDDSELEESDADEGARDEAARAQRASNVGAIIAKSLPMSIPVFMSRERSRRNHDFDDDDDDDVLTNENNLDIPASIKALAKSVHGDAVFGDLPKPRYSTYI